MPPAPSTRAGEAAVPPTDLTSETTPTAIPGRVFLFYPPGPQYQRGEDRSQGNVSDSAATVMRAPNDMGYASALLKQKGKLRVLHSTIPGEAERDRLVLLNPAFF